MRLESKGFEEQHNLVLLGHGKEWGYEALRAMTEFEVLLHELSI